MRTPSLYIAVDLVICVSPVTDKLAIASAGAMGTLFSAAIALSASENRARYRQNKLTKYAGCHIGCYTIVEYQGKNRPLLNSQCPMPNFILSGVVGEACPEGIGSQFYPEPGRCGPNSQFPMLKM